ncbi:Hypothetical predicted protein [Olea europaea subsp. europaea]|uniref:Uncharacterized protein n=1 Tax=Olea europaea subsp. europaea TaxID=158383 RepID=A0A8S0S3A6_OLEEU|nr:Hypothetical predicted protein [Olea europaea subsp. europaea]
MGRLVTRPEPTRLLESIITRSIHVSNFQTLAIITHLSSLFSTGAIAASRQSAVGSRQSLLQLAGDADSTSTLPVHRQVRHYCERLPLLLRLCRVPTEAGSCPTKN